MKLKCSRAIDQSDLIRESDVLMMVHVSIDVSWLANGLDDRGWMVEVDSQYRRDIR